ncbi:acyl carrier protein [Streptomyces sp. yr375]|uniref:acyl carrier protein n=1 Tax=Streptomyces sp. yr375 TaxID=1761906 RepID=UPI0008AF8B23|nr:acyl carrier protein [Streptomyces sp. yr375]SER47903.1 acyl carrier protein [Streptomyces sp. yr375]
MEDTREKIESDVRDLLTERFAVPADRITPDAHLFDDLGLDSVDLMSAVAILEERYDLSVSDGDLQDMLVINGVVDRFTSLLDPA